MAEQLLNLRIVTPDKIFFEGKVDKAVFSGTEGELGVLYDHIPMTTLVESTLFKIFQGKEEKIIAVHGGFVEITESQISVLTDAAEWPYEIDVNRAKESKKRALDRLKQKENVLDFSRAEVSLKRAVTRIQASEVN